MRIKTIFTLLIICCTFNACNKSKDESPTEQPYITPKLSSIIEFQNDTLLDTISFRYDNIGRLVEETISDGNRVTYNYEVGYIVKKLFFKGAEVNKADTLSLNKEGLVTFETQGNRNFQYTMEGYLQKEKSEYGNFSYRISYENTILMNEWAGNFVDLRFKWEYTFLPEKRNTIGNENRGIYFYGKQDKNLVSEVKSTYVYNGRNDVFTRSFTYEFDNKNRATKETINNLAVKGYRLYTYMN